MVARSRFPPARYGARPRVWSCLQSPPRASPGHSWQRDRHGEATAGVPSGLSVPDMASTSPRDKARPRPTPAGVVPISEPLERQEYLVPVGLGDAWTTVDHPDLDGRAVRAGRNLRRGARRAVANGVLHQVGNRPFQESRVGMYLRRVFRDADDHSGRLVPGWSQLRRRHLRHQSAGWRARAPACRRLMSSRFSTRPLSRSNDSSAVASNSARSCSVRGDPTFEEFRRRLLRRPAGYADHGSLHSAARSVRGPPRREPAVAAACSRRSWRRATVA